ncbi:MAG TPA: putative porin, partial [Myxococcota bacterium]|nr:putative porin [Myxococcota bacterium]
MFGPGRTGAHPLLCAGVIGLLTLFAAGARADDGTAVDQIVAILREKGLIDEATGDEILAKQAKSAAAQPEKATPPAGQGLLDGFLFSGDLRLRDEQFWYSRALGANAANDNNRVRYRARIGFTKQVNPWALIGVRLVSDTSDYRSTNVSVGEASDFSYDSVFFDKVYAQFLIPDPGIGLKTTLTAGKMANPFIWKNGLDKMLWDEDITPEGVTLSSSYSPTENSKLWANVGYWVELQNASHTDPRITAYQLGGSLKLAESVEAGVRASYYDFVHLANDATSATHTGFFARSEANGNLPSAFSPDMRIVESSGYVNWAAFEQWPLTVWATWARNAAAQSAVIDGVSVGDNDTAWGFGVEAGDAKKIVRLGVAWQHIEANAVSAQYTDSDMFDGKTNRQGWAVYG